VGLSIEDCGRWVAFWVGAHDIGKASPGFQQRDNTKELVKCLAEAGYAFDVSKPEPHGTVSVPALAGWLEGRGVPKVAARRVALAVGGRHGVSPGPGWSRLGTRVLGNAPWAAARNDLLDWLARLLEVPLERPMTGGLGEDQAHLMALAGLTSVADW